MDFFGFSPKTPKIIFVKKTLIQNQNTDTSMISFALKINEQFKIFPLKIQCCLKKQTFCTSESSIHSSLVNELIPQHASTMQMQFCCSPDLNSFKAINFLHSFNLLIAKNLHASIVFHLNENHFMFFRCDGY